jgi:hypothetical protein
MQFERVFSGSKIDPSFYDVYLVENILDPNPLYVYCYTYAFLAKRANLTLYF